MKDSVISMTAGGIAGLIETCIVWPFENIKTQLQLQSRKNTNFNGIYSCARYNLRSGGLKSLYHGLSPIALASIPKAGVRFTSYHTAYNWFQTRYPTVSKKQQFLAGFSAGIMEAVFVMIPSETIKTKLIDKRIPLRSGIPGILASEGLTGFYQGVAPTVVKQATNQGMRFLVFQSYMDHVKTHEIQSPFHALFGGMLAGLISAAANNPLDVLKTQMQARSYDSFWSCLRQIVKEEGYLYLYRGMGARLMRVVPGQGIVFVCFDYFQSMLRRETSGAT